MFLIDSHYYMYLENRRHVRRCLEFLSSTLNFVSERDPDEIVQTHMLSWAFADHICHKYQQGLYQLIWGPAQVDFMLGSELCSSKEHTQRMIEVRGLGILPNWEIL